MYYNEPLIAKNTKEYQNNTNFLKIMELQYYSSEFLTLVELFRENSAKSMKFCPLILIIQELC